MANGKRQRVASSERRAEKKGEWRIANGEWGKMASGEQRAASSEKRRIANGEWKKTVCVGADRIVPRHTRLGAEPVSRCRGICLSS
jgi:hypothetical protein